DDLWRRWKPYSSDEIECSNGTTHTPSGMLSHNASTRRVSWQTQYSLLDRAPVAQEGSLSQSLRLPPSPKLAPGPAFEYLRPQLSECPSPRRLCGPYSFLPDVPLHFPLRGRQTASPDIGQQGHRQRPIPA